MSIETKRVYTDLAWQPVAAANARRKLARVQERIAAAEERVENLSAGKARRWKIPRSAIRAWLVNHNNQTARRSA